MIISDICTKAVRYCRPQDSLSLAASLMWDCDCGAVPVVDEAGKLVGIITDRDICIAVATSRQYAADIPVSEVMSGKVVSCKPGDSVKEALRTMRDVQLRRLPVLDEKGILRGIVSVNDIMLAVRDIPMKAAREALTQEVMMTLMAISQHRKPREKKAAGAGTLTPSA
jgi:CBS domain-containing protein